MPGRWACCARTPSRVPPNYVPQMLDMIGTLEKNGYAYVAESR